MELVDEIVLQVTQPTFFYSTVLLSIALASSLLLIKINRTIGARWRSLMYVLPLVLPLLIVCLFPPTAFMPVPDNSYQLPVSGVQTYTGWTPFDGGLMAHSLRLVPHTIDVLSLTGLLIMAALFLGAIALGLSLLLDRWLTKRLLGVVELGPEDYPSLRAEVAALAERMGVPVPDLGLVEDLRPNAFTYGGGGKATVVFSLGLLELLDEGEVRAVIAHELAHIRNKDVRFKTLTRAMAWTSFFNPGAYLSVRAARREREKLADETARGFLEDEDALLRAIQKVVSVLEGEPAPPSLASRLGLCFCLSITENTSLLSTHPSFHDRARSLRKEREGLAFTPAVCLVLSALVVFAATFLFLSAGVVRADMIQSSLGGGLGTMSQLHSGPVHGAVMLHAIHPVHGVGVQAVHPAPSLSSGAPLASGHAQPDASRVR